MTHHLVAVLAIRVKPRQRPGDLESVSLVEPDRGCVAHAHFQFHGLQCAQGTLSKEFIHQRRSDSVLAVSFEDREHEDSRVVRCVVHSRQEADDLAILLRDEEAVPPPLVDVKVQGRGVALPKGLMNDRCNRRNVVRREGPKPDHASRTAGAGLNVTVA